VNGLNNLSVTFVTSVPVISDLFTKRLRGAALLEKGINTKCSFAGIMPFIYPLFVQIDF
jgi:hypothetical protein